MKVKLQTAITVLLLTLVIFTFSGVLVSSYHLNKDSARQMQSQIVHETAHEVYGEIDRILEVARAHLAYESRRVESEAPGSGDFPRLARSWVRALRTKPEIAFIALRLENRDTLRVARAPDGTPYIQEFRFDPQTRRYRLQVHGPDDYPGKARFSAERDLAEIEERPWVRAGERAGHDQAWTESYGFLSERGAVGVPGVAYATTVQRTDGSRIGILGVGIDVLTLCNYLKSLKVGASGFAFVAELPPAGPPRVIAHPSVDMVWRIVETQSHLTEREVIPTEAIGDVRVREFMARLPAVVETGSHARFMPIELTADRARYFGGYEYLRGTNTPEWIVCILMPESEVMAQVWQNNARLVGFALATAAVALVAGLYLVRKIAHPLAAIADETKRIAQFDSAARPPIVSPIQEVADLGVALEEMKKSLRSFRKYVPGEVARNLMQAKQTAALGGVSRVVTVFFCDIVGFTTLSERLAPEAVVEHLRGYFGAMTETITAGGGTVDKYIGDSIMAFWGAPSPDPHHALDACRTALACRAALVDLQRKWQAEGKLAMRARFGLNTGRVVVGNVGSATRMNYTVIGDAVNVASRIEGLNRLYGTEIIISDSTCREAGSTIITRPLDWVLVKGKEQALMIHELMGVRGEVVAPAVEGVAQRYSEALECYRQQDWERAITLFRSVLELRPADPPSEHMVMRCEDYRAHPPGKDWAGVYAVSEK